MEIGRDANRGTREERGRLGERDATRNGIRPEGTRMTMTRDTKAMWIGGGEDRVGPENRLAETVTTMSTKGWPVDGWLGERKGVDTVGGEG